MIAKPDLLQFPFISSKPNRSVRGVWHGGPFRGAIHNLWLSQFCSPPTRTSKILDPRNTTAARLLFEPLWATPHVRHLAYTLRLGLRGSRGRPTTCRPYSSKDFSGIVLRRPRCRVCVIDHHTCWVETRSRIGGNVCHWRDNEQGSDAADQHRILYYSPHAGPPHSDAHGINLRL